MDRSAEYGAKGNFKRVAVQAYFKPDGDTGYIHLGDVMLTKLAPEIAKQAIKVSNRGGLKSIAREDVTEASIIYTMDLQEHMIENEEILLFADQSTDYTQQALAAQNVTINAVQQRRVYDIGALDLSNVSVKVGAVAKIVGTRDEGITTPADADVVLDALAGTIYIVEGATINNGDNVTVTYDQAGMEMNTITPLSHMYRSGTLKIIESDNQSSDLRSILTFPCNIQPDNWGEATVDNPNKYTLRVVCTGKIDAKFRKLGNSD